MELVLPRNYVEIEEEEMMYLDGGGFVSKVDAANAIAITAMTPTAFLAAATSAVLVTKLLSLLQLNLVVCGVG